MKSSFIVFLLVFAAIGLWGADGNWPKEIKVKSGAAITIYQPQPESLQGDKLIGRAAFSAKEKPGDELIFGVFWYTAFLATDRDTRMASLERITINQVKLPGVEDETKLNKLMALLETEIPKWEINVSLDEIAITVEQEQKLANHNYKNDAPVIYFKTQLTTLVILDGEPKLQQDDKLKMKRVINTPFLIVENPDDKKFYLNNGKFWYVSSSMKEGYKPVSPLPNAINKLDQELKKKQTVKDTTKTTTPPELLISITPAELLQTKGVAQYANVDKTSLLYISNSEDDIFKNISDQKFYVLLSGRWYTSSVLEGPWVYLPSDQLPADFAHIPEGSDKDNVLSSVPGTQASRDAVMDAQIPQTAKVDRKTATCTVAYDGEPKFENIEGTSMQLAMNTSSTVIKSAGKYYCVETGIWFVADGPKGPWKVSDTRPSDVEKIPASSPAYNTQYVYIYDSTPDVVYVGYTPGYMGCYVYGGTVIYGTGYYYNPWYGPYYYPHPVTYGYGMHYNPYVGWSVSFHFGYGYHHGGGYWGPPVYRPPYYAAHHGGMYGGRGNVYVNNGDINIDRSNNVYNNRKDVSTNDVKRNQTPSQQPSTRDQGRDSKPKASQQPVAGNGRNDVYGDKNGNVYQRKDNGDWNQRNGNQWQNTNQPSNNMNRDYDNRQRSANQNSNFQQSNHGGNMGGASRGGGGGGRRR